MAAEQFEERTLDYQDESGTSSERFAYRLLSPERIESGKKYPVVLFLHGAGERGDDNERQLKHLPEQMATPEYRRRFACYLVAPQCPADATWTRAGLGRKSSASNLPGRPLSVALAILDEVLQSEAADRRRVYLTGLSMGGFGCWDAAVRHPQRFAAVVPICGGGDEAAAERLVNVPIWALHGDQDDVVSVEFSRTMIEAIRRAGGNPRYSELAGVGHHSWTPAYADPDGVIAWMFEQQKAGTG